MKKRSDVKMAKNLIERTLVLLKPDAVQRSLVGTIVTRLENAGLKIVGMKMVWADADFSKKHYSAHVKKKFYPVEIVRKIVGSTEPSKALPGTIRGDFAHHAYEYADKKGIAIKNLIHASDSKASAKKEIELWFDKKELHSYKTVHEMHVF